MSRKTKKADKSIEEIARELGRYPVEAFEFLRQGLDFTVQRTHGDTAVGMKKIIGWLDENDASLEELPQLAGKGKAPIWLLELLEKLGGVESATKQVNLHVCGTDLCCGLRDLALKKWGLMAPVVLAHWGIRSTLDFGKMVFALVNNGFLQKQPHDALEDFKDVYDFPTAFEKSYTICTHRQEPAEDEVEADD